MKIKRVEKVGRFEDEHVYDLVVSEEKPYFFGNGLLLHNSAYVSLKTIHDTLVEEGLEGDALIDELVKIADTIGDEINDSFPKMMEESFFVTEESGAIIQAGREVVARRGLFKNAKKRYALAVIDTEGFRSPKLKIMGMETQRSDTPHFIQDFLKDCVRLVVQEGHEEMDLRDKIEIFRNEFHSREPWLNGTPCRVSNLTAGSELLDKWFNWTPEKETARPKKPLVHWSVMAAWRTNQYRKRFGETVMEEIRDGDKIEILRLNPNDKEQNPLGFETVALPVGAARVPDWFKNLPFDTTTHEEKLIDSKIDNVFGVLNWDLSKRKNFADDVFS